MKIASLILDFKTLMDSVIMGKLTQDARGGAFFGKIWPYFIRWVWLRACAGAWQPLTLMLESTERGVHASASRRSFKEDKMATNWSHLLEILAAISDSPLHPEAVPELCKVLNNGFVFVFIFLTFDCKAIVLRYLCFNFSSQYRK